MPYINTKINFTLDQKNEKDLKKAFGKAITLFPGKSERYLMLNFEDNCHLYFGGQNEEKIAMVEVKLFGTPEPTACDQATQTFTEILSQQLGINPMNIYIKYEGCSFWGMGGTNF
ncbi:MAG: hypothetical protein HFE77_03495 [Clostridiales bacterium]|nr:hypothetical protein [Clostridiales bacterium]